jgi:hypothetical protein
MSWLNQHPARPSARLRRRDPSASSQHQAYGGEVGGRHGRQQIRVLRARMHRLRRRSGVEQHGRAGSRTCAEHSADAGHEHRRPCSARTRLASRKKNQVARDEKRGTQASCYTRSATASMEHEEIEGGNKNTRPCEIRSHNRSWRSRQQRRLS